MTHSAVPELFSWITPGNGIAEALSVQGLVYSYEAIA